MVPCSELLFFDTFSHESPPEEELNLDLVQFPSPVVVDEVRVIPLGARVQANFPGGVRLGATNPTNFDLEFFVNDLTKPGSSTFESLGVLPYRNDGKIHLGTEKKIPTDGLVLRGLYTAITLAVYGTFSKSTPEQLALQGSVNGSEAKHTPQRSPRPSSRRQSTESILDDMSDISDGDIPDAEDFIYAGGNRRFVKEVEELSDEEVLEWSDEELVRIDFLEEEEEEDPVKTLDPLVTLENAASLKYFRLLGGEDSFSVSHEEEMLSEADWEKLSSSEEAPSTGEWVEHIEAVSRNLLDVLRAEEDYRDRLLHYADVGLDMEKALAQSMPTFKVRHIKSGLKLILSLVRWGGDFVEDLLLGNIYSKLLAVFEDKYMAISLRLLILRIMDSLMNYAHGMETFLSTTYENIMRLCLSKQSTRSKFALAALARKAHLNEVMEQLSDRVSEEHRGEEDELTALLDEIHDTYNEAKLRISQSDRFLPVKSHFELSDNVFYDSKPGYFSLLRNNGVLHSLLLLLTNPKVSQVVAVSVHRLLDLFSASQEGLIFMADEPEVINRIIEALLATDCQPLAEKIAYRVQVISLLDELYDHCKDKMSRRDCECSEVLLTIQDIYGLTFDDIRGKQAVAEVLGFEDNLEILIRLAKHESGKDMKKSAIRGYACELISLTIKVREDVSYLRRFSPQLLNLVKFDEHSRLYELVPWVSPLEDLNKSSSPKEETNNDEENENADNNIDDDEIAITRLCESVKKSLEPFNGGISPSLITSIRLLALYLLQGDEEDNELHKTKYHFLIAFSKHLYEHFLSILTKVSGLYDQPHLRVGSLTSYSHGSLLVSLLCPLLRTLRHLLRFVIQSRGVEFQDLRPIGSLLRTYTLSLAFPQGSYCHFFGEQIRGETLQTILSFTQPPFDPAKHNMGDSLWKKTVKEIMDFTLSSPHFYTPGLRVLSEILPLPLPMESADALQPVDVKSALHLRKLWSGHLFPLEASLGDLVATLSGCVSSALLRLMKRVLVQISDLSYHSSSMVSKALLEALRRNEEDVGALKCALGFLGDALANGAIKSSFLALTRAEEDNKNNIYDTFQRILSSTPCLEAPVFKILNRLLDPCITVTSGSSVNGLPSKAQVNAILAMCMEHLNSPLLLETILGSFYSLSSNEYGFYSLRTAFFRSPTAMKTIFQVLSEKFEKKNIRLWLDILKNLTSGPNHLSAQELAHLLQWKSGAEDVKQEHPMSVLKAMLGGSAEGSGADMSKELEATIQILTGSGSDSDAHAIKLSLSLLCDNDTSFPAPECLSAQFEARDVWVTAGEVHAEMLEDDDELLGENRVEVDLHDFAEKCLPKDFQLPKELDNLSDDFETLAKKRKTHQPVSREKALLEAPKSLAAGYKVGSSGHRQNNGRFSRPGQRVDAFRSRPPNTSRPPSLHVDDFLVLQSLGQQPTGPTGYNKQSVKAAKELFAQREAAQGKSSVVGYREATDKPVYTEQRSSNNNNGLPSPGGSGDSRRPNNNNNRSASNNRVRNAERSERNRPGVPSGGRANYRGNERPRDRNNSGRYSPRYSPLAARGEYREEPGEGRRFSSSNNNGGGNSSSRRSGAGAWSNNDRNSRTKDRFSASRSRNGSRNREDSRQRHMRPLAR